MLNLENSDKKLDGRVLGEGSTFYERDDSYGFKLFSEEIKLLSSLNTDELILEKKEEEKVVPRRKRKNTKKGKEKRKENLISLPWGGRKGAESLLDHHNELNRQKKEKYINDLDLFCKNIGKTKEQALQGNFVTLSSYNNPSKITDLHKKRKKEYDQICLNITNSYDNSDYEEECRNVLSQFPFFFENGEELQKAVKNKEISFFARSWSEKSIYAFILYENTSLRKTIGQSQASIINSLLKSVNLIKSPWNSEVYPSDYNIKEITQKDALIPFLKLLDLDYSYCYNLDDFKDIKDEVELGNTGFSFYHFVKKSGARNRKTEVHYFMKKSSSGSK